MASAACLALVAARADVIEDQFNQFDKNHDGVLSGDELNAAPYLRQLDLNGDGKVTLEEARTAISLLRESTLLKKFAKQLGGNAGATPPAASGSADATANARPALGDGHLIVQWLFKRYDKNGDGKLTPDELPDKKWFARLDLNKDGVITLEEAQQALGPMIANHGSAHGLPKTAGFSE
ncbi:MAG TPA: hypothetical protein VHV08_06050, partial [Pirellulales bacterium]|nr:hypothetical protein [Pirellulales bacterium]